MIELTKAPTPYEVDTPPYPEIKRGQIMANSTGRLKLLFGIETHKWFGVGILGEGASKLVHIGQTALSFSGTIKYFIDFVFNYLTLEKCYKTTECDGLNRLE